MKVITKLRLESSKDICLTFRGYEGNHCSCKHIFIKEF